MPLPNPWHELLESFTHVNQYDSWFPGRVNYLRDYTRWRNQVRHGPNLPATGPERLTVVLLSYRRVRNIEPMVNSLLRADFVGRVLVSNNNPAYRISDWVRVRDERLHLVDQSERRYAGIRFELARGEQGEYFASIDDDTFLSPEQLRQLFTMLVTDPSTPHGIQGELYKGRPGEPTNDDWRPGLVGERRVDAINRVYFFTREHLEELYRLAGLLGLNVPTLANGEDLLLSACGRLRPRVHDVGPVAQCLSAHRLGVATWRTRQDFFQERTDLLLRLRQLKPLADS
ncbi:glycosyltransferase family 2 protein [Archangium lipolyticum]|uniref:glycosyltransferase family 2 protein n=1 Tax=Archangium lipolyticum TaxID=2970465 RepID=UPI00214A11AB|nr:glycosyltransferase family A protein [Archangium lipolyticum]